MQKLLFKNPVFNKGLNLTCRKGTKWSGVTGSVILAETGTTEYNDKYLGIAHIVNTKAMRLMDIQEDDLLLEHDPSCRTWQGLHDELVRVYGSIDKREIITLVLFKQISFPPVEPTKHMDIQIPY
jgi:hypothetical protein